MSEALNEALREEMRRDDGVFVIGEDIGRHGGLFKVTDGLLARVRPGAGDRLADLRGRHLGRRRRRCARRVPAGGRAPDLRLHHARRWTRSSTTPPSGATCRAARCRVPFVIRGADLERHRDGGAALAEPRVVVRAHAGARRRDAVDAVRRERPAEGGDPRGQPRRLPREAPALRRKGPVPEAEYVVPIGVRRRQARAAATSPSSPPARPSRSRCRPPGSSRARASSSR